MTSIENPSKAKSDKPQHPDTPVVETHTGPVTGFEKNGLSIFRGIPFAASAGGANRFKAPQPIEPWQGVRSCRQFSPAAMQNDNAFFGVGPMDEDCLSLNVFSPDLKGKRPVMVWIHGGAFVAGASSQVIYKGDKFCRNGDVVLVTINYRLGVLGLGYFAELLKEKDTSANNTIRDQIVALQWVQQNIAQFGGDADNVTIFGESAGAMSVGTLLASPMAKGLFHKAILQSGACDHAISKEEATKVARDFCHNANINPDTEADKLWQLSPKEIIKIQMKTLDTEVVRGKHTIAIPQRAMPFMPVVDGEVLPDYPLELIKQGAAKEIPLMIGSTREEWNFFMKTPLPGGLSAEQKLRDKMDKAKLTELIERNLPGFGESAAHCYLQSPERQHRSDLYDVFIDFESDRMFRIPAIQLATQQASFNTPVFCFLFTWDKGLMGAAHAVDVPFLFGEVEKGFGQFLTGGAPEAVALSDRVQKAWAAFAYHGNPSTPEGCGHWPTYNKDQYPTMEIGEQVEVLLDPMKEERMFWEQFYQ